MNTVDSSSSSSSSKQMKALPPHKFPEDAQAFLASLNETERSLQTLAQEKLGSCYFMEKTHAYKKWKANQKK
jgi:hypothetical protein